MPIPTTSLLWRPALNTTWQWQLSDPVDPSLNVEMVDIDMFENDSRMVEALHAQGKKVIGYISMGSWEDWRPDRNQFPTSVIGKKYTG
jgi:hypothetical protein